MILTLFHIKVKRVKVFRILADVKHLINKVEFNMQRLISLLRHISFLTPNTPLKLQVHNDHLVIKSIGAFYTCIKIWVACDTKVHSLLDSYLPLASMFHVVGFFLAILAAPFVIP